MLILLAVILSLALARPAVADSGHSVVYPPNAHVHGQAPEHWLTQWWRWAYAQPLATNPLFEQSGAHCADGQSGPVWYLMSFFVIGDTTSSCTLPAHTPIAVMLSGTVADYPCPDPSYQPAPGQSLEDFLAEQANSQVEGSDSGAILTVTLDGRTESDIFAYRYTTPLFTFTGDPSLRAFDPCVTGSPQQGVAAGYLEILKGLRPGTHTLRLYAAAPAEGIAESSTWTLHVVK